MERMGPHRREPSAREKPERGKKMVRSRRSPTSSKGLGKRNDLISNRGCT